MPQYSLPDTIKIEVETAYINEQSNPDDDQYVFGYTITIRNEGNRPAQLLTRCWLITDANGKVREVQGDGVVGEQPDIAAGGYHQYSSGAVLETPVGTMEGNYGMRSDDGTEFRAAIPVFRLAVPEVLN